MKALELNKRTVIAFGAVVVLLLVSMVAYPRKSPRDLMFPDIEKEIPKGGPLVDAKAYSSTKADYWEIIDTSTNLNFPTGLRIFERNNPDLTVTRWNNFLLGINKEYYLNKNPSGLVKGYPTEKYTLQSQITSVRVYNIDSREVFDISLDTPTEGEITYINAQILDDKYYFGIGENFGALLQYKLDLPPTRTSRITKSNKPFGSKVERIGNTYISSFCYEGCSYLLFNPVSLTGTPLKRMTEASGYTFGKKEHFIGIDSRGRMILNVQDDTPTIAAVPLTNENLTITLIQESDMPEKMTRYIMIDGIDKIMMFGESKVYIYNLQLNIFNEVVIGAEMKEYLASENRSPYVSIYTKTDDTVCFTSQDTVNYAIDLISEKYLDPPPNNCRSLNHRDGAQDIFEKLNLPDNLVPVLTPVKYGTYSIIRGIPELEIPKNSEIISTGD